jgi:hypothetical protein
MKPSALASLAASMTLERFSSGDSFSKRDPMRPCSMLVATVVAKRVGSCETSPIWLRSQRTLRSLISTPSSLREPSMGSLEVEGGGQYKERGGKGRKGRDALETEEKTNDRRLPAAATANECRGLASREDGVEVVKDRDVCSVVARDNEAYTER